MFRSRILVTVLALWGLAMIVPDLVRVMNPLGSFGFYADNDGLIYSISGPFEERAASPAWQAGLRVGDRLDLDRLSCSLSSIQSCSPALTVLGGIEFVLPGKAITLSLAATSRAPAREVTLVAAQRPANFLVRAVNLACQIAGILVVIAAAWLVWTRPSAMSWGFFLYVNWFNPGQYYAFYAILQQWPAALAFSGHRLLLRRGRCLCGLLLFVLRVPNNETEPRWLPLERTLPAAGLICSTADARLVCEHIRSWQRDPHARDDLPRLCHRPVCARHPIRPTQHPSARGLSACALGDLGLLDRAAGLPHRRACLDHHDSSRRGGRISRHRRMSSGCSTS